MARINIEDQFWVDIMGVIASVGDADRAIGNAIRFLKYAQEIHKQGKVISEDEFKSNGFSESLFPSIAKRTPSGIKAAGSEKYFSWLDQKKAAGKAGGKKSAKRPRDEKGRLIACGTKRTQANPSGHQPSISISNTTTSDSKKFELRFDPRYQEFEKAVLSVTGFTPSFRALLPNMYDQWKDDIDGLIVFIEGRIAASEKKDGTRSEKQAWLRSALIGESDLEVG